MFIYKTDDEMLEEHEQREGDRGSLSFFLWCAESVLGLHIVQLFLLLLCVNLLEGLHTTTAHNDD